MKYEYVSHNGALWRMSKREYARLVKVIQYGQEYNLDQFGVMVTTEVRFTRDIEEKGA